ncbi:MAG: EamA family transporter RarD [Chloroflexota bacterium]
MNSQNQQNQGIILALTTFLLWGLLPVYWKFIAHVPALEILAHRVIWSLFFLIILLLITRDWGWLAQIRHNRRLLLAFCASSTVLSINWLTYIWAVNAGYVVETSLGYFINPLVSVFLGVVFLHEQIRWGQWVAVGVATIGVLYLTIGYGALPWIGLSLAFSFGIYGLIRKTAPLSSQQGLAFETTLMIPFALIYLAWLEMQGVGAFGQMDLNTNLILMGAGIVTAVPLLTFAAAARRIPLSMVGLFQYIAPSIQFLLGIYVYHEPFTQTRLIGFSIIWLALCIYAVEGTILRTTKTAKGY